MNIDFIILNLTIIQEKQNMKIISKIQITVYIINKALNVLILTLCIFRSVLNK